METYSVFDKQMCRIQFITGAHTQLALADFLGIRQSAVSDAKRRGKIPAEWLVILMWSKNVSPEWIRGAWKLLPHLLAIVGKRFKFYS